MLAPIQYDSQTKTVRIFTDITFDVVTCSSEAMYSAAEAIGSASLEYDENPSLDSRFYAAPIGCGSFLTVRNSTTGVESSSFVYVLEDIIGTLMAEKGYGWNRQYFSPSYSNPLKWYNGTAIPEELKRPNFAWDANYESEVQAINNKAFFCLLYFHGARDGYMNPHLRQAHVSLLNNKGFYPVFFSIGCSTGKNFTNNFAHSFLSKKDAGAVAVFANTEIGLMDYGDHMIYGMFNAVWPSRRLSGKMETLLPNYTPFYRLGEIMKFGNSEMEAYNHSPYKYFDLHCREVMHCFGDASMMIRTQRPIPFKGVSVTSTMGRLDVVLNEYKTGDMVTYILPDGEIKSYRAAKTSATYSPLGMTTGVEVWLSGPNRPLTLCRSASNDNLLPDRGSNILACYITSSLSKICNVRFNLDVNPSNAELKVVSQYRDVIASQSCRYAEADDNRVYTQAINLGNISQGTYIVTLVTGGSVAHSVQVYVK